MSLRIYLKQIPDRHYLTQWCGVVVSIENDKGDVLDAKFGCSCDEIVEYFQKKYGVMFELNLNIVALQKGARSNAE